MTDSAALRRGLGWTLVALACVVLVSAQDEIRPAGMPAGLADATYITQTASDPLTAEQALGGLASGIMRVATTTGVVTSLTTSAGIAANLSDETGSGALVFGTSPTFTTGVTVGAAGVPGNLDFGNDMRILGVDGSAEFYFRNQTTFNTGTVLALSYVNDDGAGGVYRLAGSGTTGLLLGSGSVVGWSSTTASNGALDTQIGRAAANLLELAAGDSFNLNPAGVRLSSDGDGAITLLGLGNGFDEDLTVNLDDSSNVADWSSTTGVTTFRLNGMDLSLNNTNGIVNATSLGMTAGGTFEWAGRGLFKAPVDGEVNPLNGAETISSGFRIRYIVENNIATKAVAATESREFYNDSGDADGSIINLPDDPTAGLSIGVAAVSGQVITINTGVGETIWLAGASCGTDITGSDTGASLLIVAVVGGAGGVWHAIGSGVWTC